MATDSDNVSGEGWSADGAADLGATEETEGSPTSSSGRREHGPHVVTQRSRGSVALAQNLANLAAECVDDKKAKQWWDENEEINLWTRPRRFAALFIFSTAFETLMMLVIMSNLFFIIYQTDKEAECYPVYADRPKECPTNGDNIMWLKWVNTGLVIFYTIEAVVKIYVARKKYFEQVENLFDFFICTFSVIAEVLDGLIPLSWLRVFRLWRLVRVLNAMSKVPEIHMLVAGLSGAIRAIFFGAILLGVSLLLCSIMLVQFIHPIAIKLNFGECERCSRGFASVIHSVLTLFQQIVAGDSWGLISIPIIEYNPWIGVILPLMQLLIAMGITNLILAVVVDRSVEAREQNKDRQMQEKKSISRKRKVSLLRTISKFDSDKSGTLSRQEIAEALGNSDEFQQILHSAGIDRGLLDVLLETLADEEGEVKYETLCAVIHDFESAELRTFLVLGNITNCYRHDKHERHLEKQKETLDRIEEKLEGLALHTSGSVFVGSLPDESATEASEIAQSLPIKVNKQANHTDDGGECNLRTMVDNIVIEPLSFTSSLAAVEQLTSGLFEQIKLMDVLSEARIQLQQEMDHITEEFGHLRAADKHQQEGLLHNLKNSLQSTLAATSMTQYRLFAGEVNGSSAPNGDSSSKDAKLFSSTSNGGSALRCRHCGHTRSFVGL